MGSTASKTYGKTASGKQITDELIDALVRKAEAGYEAKKLTEPMDIAEAKVISTPSLTNSRRLVSRSGVGTTGRSRSGKLNGPGAECAPRHGVDDPPSG